MPPPDVCILAPLRPGDGMGGAERHLVELGAVLRAVGANVRFLDRGDAPAPSPVESLLCRAVPLLRSPLASSRLRGQRQIVSADVVLSVELMGCGIRHPRHLHLFFGSYAAFRQHALQPTSRARALARLAVDRLSRALENRTQGHDGAVANSLGLRDHIRAAGVRVRAEVIVPPTDTERFQPRDRGAARARLALPRDRRLLLFAGRWEYAKGADRLERLLDALPDPWDLLLACPSRASRSWPRLARTHLLLDVPHDRMPDVYAAADVLIQPSRFEGYSLVVSEAQACGCPVITSAVGHAEHLRLAPPAVRDGIVDRPDDPAAWLGALARISGTPARLREASAAAREFVERVTSARVVAQQWYELLRSLYPELEWHPPR